MAKKAFWIIFAFLFLGLQYKLWFAEDNVFRMRQIQTAISQTQAQNQALQQRNQTLNAVVADLKNGKQTVEEHAREDLGMIKQGETFYQVVEEPKQENKKQ